MSNWVVIVPSNRPEEVKKFVGAWWDLFQKHRVDLVLMWDLPSVPEQFAGGAGDAIHLSHKDLTTSFIPTKTDMVRSFAFKWAYDNFPEAKYFLTLDDDVRPLKLKDGSDHDIFEQYEIGFQGDHLSEYFSVGSLTSTPMEIEMRGFPYKDRVVRDVAVQYGGWCGVLDYDAATQLSNPRNHEVFAALRIPVPKGAACTCCIMNCAWKREYTPIMWQLPMLDGRYNRVGDIWSGLLIKKTLDAIGAVMVVNGSASVLHQRASNPYNSLVKEAPSVWLNDHLWENLANPEEELTKPDMMTAYACVVSSAAEFFHEHDREYAEHFIMAFDEWESLWQ